MSDLSYGGQRAYYPGYLDIVLYMARKYYGAPDDWRWRFRKIHTGSTYTYQGSVIKGTNPNGTCVWHDPEVNPLEFSVTLDEYMTARVEYEHDTGKCVICQGGGRSRSWKDNRYQTGACDCCGGDGHAVGRAEQDRHAYRAALERAAEVERRHWRREMDVTDV